MPIRGKTEFMSFLSAALKTKAGGSLAPRGKAAIHFNIKKKRNLLLLMKGISSVRRKVLQFLLGEEEGGKMVPLRQIHNKIYYSTDKTLPTGGMLQERRVFFVR